MNDNTIPAAAWRGHPAAGKFLGVTEFFVATAFRQVTHIDESLRETAENPGVLSLQPPQGLPVQSAGHQVFVIAANRLLRDLLCDLVAAKPDFHLVGSEPFADPGALELLDTTANTIVLLCLSEISNSKQLLNYIETVRAALGNLRLVLIGMPPAEHIFLAAVRAGVAGYVLDDASMEEVLAAVHFVARGDVACPSQLLPDLFRWVAAQPVDAIPQGTSNRFGLSRRERQLVPLIARGLTNKEIASELGLSEQTVKNHLRHMMRKAGAANRFAVVNRCQTAFAASI